MKTFGRVMLFGIAFLMLAAVTVKLPLHPPKRLTAPVPGSTKFTKGENQEMMAPPGTPVSPAGAMSEAFKEAIRRKARSGNLYSIPMWMDTLRAQSSGFQPIPETDQRVSGSRRLQPAKTRGKGARGQATGKGGKDFDTDKYPGYNTGPEERSDVFTASDGKIYVAWRYYDGNYHVAWNYSTDGGVTWAKGNGEVLTIGSGEISYVGLAVSGQDILIIRSYLQSEGNDNVNLSYSHDGGATWDIWHMFAQTYIETVPVMAVDNNGWFYLMLTMVSYSGGGCKGTPGKGGNKADLTESNIPLYVSKDGGTVWDGIWLTSDANDGGNHIKAPGALGISGGGASSTLLFSYNFDYANDYWNNGTNNFQVYYRQITNAGKAAPDVAGDPTIGARTLISGQTGITYIGPNGCVCNDAGTGYITYTRNGSVYLKKTTSTGSSWGGEITISSTGNSYWPCVAMDYDANPLVIYQAGGTVDILLRWSDDGGSSWFPAKNVSDNPGSVDDWAPGMSILADNCKRRPDIAWSHDYGGADYDIAFDKNLQYRCQITLNGIDATHNVTTENRISFGADRSLTYTSAGTYIIYVDDGTILRFPEWTDDAVLFTENTREWTVTTCITQTINYGSPTTAPFAFDVYSGGTIDVQNWEASGMNEDGIYLHKGSIITNFENVTLSDVPAGGALLQLECAGPLTFWDIKFNTPADYNVKTTDVGQKAMSPGMYWFKYNGVNGGDIPGDQYDWDPGDDDWTPPNTPGISSASSGWIIWGEPYGVELALFDAQAGYEKVLLSWLTEVEFDNYKWLIARRIKQAIGHQAYGIKQMTNDKCQMTNDWEIIAEVPAKVSCGEYAYTDSLVKGGITYSYLLGDISTQGDTTWHNDLIREATPKAYKIFKFALHQGYPNPFANRTTIQYTVPGRLPTVHSLPTTLKIYDISGSVVRTLVSGRKKPGEYRAVWDGRIGRGKLVAQGVYFLKLECGNKTRTKKLLLLK